MKEIETMTAKELKEFLNQFPDDTKVVFSYPSGDHWRTQLAGEIQESTWRKVKYTEYHRCFEVTDPEDTDNLEMVLVLGN